MITGEEGDGEVEVVLGEEAGLEVWAEELLCGLAGGEGVVEPALCEGHGEGSHWQVAVAAGKVGERRVGGGIGARLCT